MSKPSTLDREYLEIRSLLLQAGAALDRLDRCPASDRDDPRRKKLDSAVKILEETVPGRAGKIQMLFSREFDPDWKKQWELAPRTV